MKKLLTILSSFAITATGAATVVACAKNEESAKNLADLYATADVTSNDEVVDFKAALIVELQKKEGFDKIADGDLDVFKQDGTTVLAKDDLKPGAIDIKIKAKGDNFTGEKEIKVTWTKSTTAPVETDLDTLLDDNATVTSLKTIDDFKTNLIAKLAEKDSAITATSIEIKKEDGTPLADSDIKTGIKVKISHKGDDFKVEKVITVTWTEKKLRFKILKDNLLW